MKHCHKCNKEFLDDKQYCDTCGKKLKSKIDKEYASGLKNKKKWFSIKTIIFVVLVLFVILRTLANIGAGNPLLFDKPLVIIFIITLVFGLYYLFIYIKSKKHKNKTEEMSHIKREKDTHKLNIAPWAIPLIVLGGLLVIVGVILLPTKVISYQIEVPYIDKEQYSVQVPYEDVEEYTVQVPYEVKEPYVESVPVEEQKETVEKQCSQVALKYEINLVKCQSGGFFSTGESSYEVKNLDTESDIFTIKVGYKDANGQFIGNAISKNINALSSATFSYSPVPSSATACSRQVVSIPTKEVCELVPTTKTTTVYKDVIKEKTVTQYRDETRYRKVTKTRSETREKEVRKTKIETKQKEINWIFGFNAIIKFRNL